MGYPDARAVAVVGACNFLGTELIKRFEEDRRYDRIVSIAVFEHLTDLPACLASAGLLLNPGGHLQVGIPSEGGFLWWLGWRTTTGIAFKRRYGLDYGKRMRHEHINTAPEIIALARHFFNEVSLQRFPTPFHQLSFYAHLRSDGGGEAGSRPRYRRRRRPRAELAGARGGTGHRCVPRRSLGHISV